MILLSTLELRENLELRFRNKESDQPNIKEIVLLGWMGVHLLKGVHLLFLTKFPGATFIWAATLIWSSRVVYFDQDELQLHTVSASKEPRGSINFLDF